MAAEAVLDASAIVRSRRSTLSVAFDDERVASWAANEVMRRRASRWHTSFRPRDESATPSIVTSATSTSVELVELSCDSATFSSSMVDAEVRSDCCHGEQQRGISTPRGNQ
jgi:hypothetical protein